ncbi:MAG: hypothetical protein AB1598_04045 [Thermodesulfobacteriota bacterium]
MECSIKRFAALVWSARRRAGSVYKRGFVIPVLLALHFLAPANEASAVGGISNSKVIVPSTDTVPAIHVEVEPFFSLEFEDDGNHTVRFGGGLRVTPGLFENLEAGVNINYLNVEDSGLIRAESDFGDIEAGVKFRFLDEGKGIPFSLAYQGGVTFPLGDGALWVVEPGGLILTKNFTDKFSMDADFVFGIIEHGSWSFVTDVGFGYFLTPWLQAVAEGAYAYEDPDEGAGISVVNITGGFTATAAEWLTVIVGVTPDVYTKNADKLVVVSAAFTFFF